MSSPGLTTAGGSRVARNVVQYKPTTSLVGGAKKKFAWGEATKASGQAVTKAVTETNVQPGTPPFLPETSPNKKKSRSPLRSRFSPTRKRLSPERQRIQAAIDQRAKQQMQTNATPTAPKSNPKPSLMLNKERSNTLPSRTKSAPVTRRSPSAPLKPRVTNAATSSRPHHHFCGGPPAVFQKEHALRLVCTILQTKTNDLTKDTIDRAIERVQQMKNQSEKGTDKNLVDVHVLKAELDIKTVELSIRTKERDQKETKLRELLKEQKARARSPFTNNDTATTADLQKKLAATERRLQEAQQEIKEFEAEKQSLQDDFEETNLELQSKVDQLKNVLIACNERRRNAETTLIDLGHYDEAQQAEISRKHPDELVNEIIFRELRARGDSEIDKLQASLEATRAHNKELQDRLQQQQCEDDFEHGTKVSQLREELGNCRQQHRQRETQTTKKLHEARTLLKLAEKKEQETSSSLQSKLIETEEKLVSSEIRCRQLNDSLETVNAKYSALTTEMGEAEQNLRLYEAARAQSEHDTAQSAKIVSELSESLQETTARLERVEEQRDEYREKVDQVIVERLKIETETDQLRTRLRDIERQSSQPLKRPAVSVATDKSTTINSDVTWVPDDNTSSVTHSREGSTELQGMMAELHESTAKLAAIETRFTDSQEKARQSLNDVDDSGSYDIAWVPPQEKPHFEDEAVKLSEQEKIATIASLEEKLEDYKAKLEEAETIIAASVSRVNARSLIEESQEGVRQSMEEIKDLRRRVASADKELLDANDKLLFLRNLILSVVPVEEGKIQDLDDESKAAVSLYSSSFASHSQLNLGSSLVLLGTSLQHNNHGSSLQLNGAEDFHRSFVGGPTTSIDEAKVYNNPDGSTYEGSSNNHDESISAMSLLGGRTVVRPTD